MPGNIKNSTELITDVETPTLSEFLTTQKTITKLDGTITRDGIYLMQNPEVNPMIYQLKYDIDEPRTELGKGTELNAASIIHMKELWSDMNVAHRAQRINEMGPVDQKKLREAIDQIQQRQQQGLNLPVRANTPAPQKDYTTFEIPDSYLVKVNNTEFYLMNRLFFNELSLHSSIFEKAKVYQVSWRKQCEQEALMDSGIGQVLDRMERELHRVTKNHAKERKESSLQKTNTHRPSFSELLRPPKPHSHRLKNRSTPKKTKRRTGWVGPRVGSETYFLLTLLTRLLACRKCPKPHQEIQFHVPVL
jgi:hypothetical protein